MKKIYRRPLDPDQELQVDGCLLGEVAQIPQTDLDLIHIDRCTADLEHYPDGRALHIQIRLGKPIVTFGCVGCGYHVSHSKEV